MIDKLLQSYHFIHDHGNNRNDVQVHAQQFYKSGMVILLSESNYHKHSHLVGLLQSYTRHGFIYDLVSQ